MHRVFADTFEEHAQDGLGFELADSRFGVFLSPLSARIRALCAFQEHAQDGLGFELTAQSYAGVPFCLAASIRALCAFYWVALVHRKDASNKAALAWSREAADVLIYTTEEVLTEVLAFCSSDEALRAGAVRIVRIILTATTVRVVPQSHQTFLDGLAFYEARPHKGYSLTDCMSMQAMRREGLTDVLTNDRHCGQEGFQALFRG